MCLHVGHIPEETNMAQLIQLVMTDGLNGHILPDVVQIRFRRCQRRKSGAREGHL